MQHVIFALILVFFSGASALVYQITWQRYLSTFLGSNALASSLVLACFFLFMSLGYFFLGRWTKYLLKNKILMFCVLEFLIGIYGFVSPDIFDFLSSALSVHTSNWWTDNLLNLTLTSLFIGFPTFLMGGTLPILTQGLVKSFDISHRIHAWIYSINTLGAFCGTLLAGFYFIETHGLALTLFFASMANFVVAFGAVLLSKAPQADFEGIEIMAQEKESLVENRWSLYLISFLSGFYVFTFESLIIRMAVLSQGPITYTYTIIVASFILAIALGSFSISLFSRIRGFNHLLWVQTALIVSLIFLYLSVPHWPSWITRLRILIQPALINLPFLWMLYTLFFILILLIPVGLMGMQLPLLFSLLKEKKVYLAETVGRVYAMNSLGSFFGALFGGYTLFLYFEAPTIAKIAIASVILTLLLILFFFRTELSNGYKIITYAVAGTSLTALVFLPFWPHRNYAPSMYAEVRGISGEASFESLIKNSVRESSDKNLLFAKYGPNSQVVVVDSPDATWGRTLYINGKPDAATKLDDNVRSFNILFPLLFSPKIEEIFIIGLGASRSLGIATLVKDVKNVEVVEMSEGVIESRHLFDEHAFKVSKRKNKYQIIQGDAFKVLKSSNKTYDLIVSEPSNPWVEGVEKLYSFEFLSQAKSKLSPDGYYTQWFPLFNMDGPSFVSIIKTFRSVFPWVTVWRSAGMTVLIMAGEKPFPVPAAYWEGRFSELKMVFNEYGWSRPESLLTRQALSEWGVNGLAVSDVDVQSLQKPFLAYKAARAQLINQFASLPSILDFAIKKPPESGDPLSQFMYENLPEIPWAAIQDSENFLKRDDEKNNPFSSLMHKRLVLATYAKQPQAFKDKPKVVESMLPYLALDPKQSSSFSFKEEPSKSMEAYSNLWLMQKPIAEKRLLDSLKPCDSKPCLSAKFGILLKFREAEFKDFKETKEGFSSEEKRKINEYFLTL